MNTVRVKTSCFTPGTYFSSPKEILSSDMGMAEKITYAGLATYLSAGKCQVYPSMSGIVQATRLSRSEVFRCINVLVQKGWITKEKGASPIGTNLYTLHQQPLQPAGVQWAIVSNGRRRLLGTSPDVQQTLVANSDRSPIATFLGTSPDVQQTPKVIEEEEEEETAETEEEDCRAAENNLGLATSLFPAEVTLPPNPAPKAKKPPKVTDPRVNEFKEWFKAEFLRITGRDYILAHAKDGALIKGLLRDLTLEQMQTATAHMFADKQYGRPSASIGTLTSQINKWMGQPSPGSPNLAYVRDVTDSIAQHNALVLRASREGNAA